MTPRRLLFLILAAKDAASFRAHGMDVPMLPRSRPGVWLLAIGSVGSLALAARRKT